MDSERLRRARKSRCDLFFETLQRSLLPAFPRYHDDRGGINRLAGRFAAYLSGRPRIRFEMEHGLDARLPAIHESRSNLSPLSSRQHNVFAPLRFSGTFHSCAQSRRSRAWQALTFVEDAGRRMAKVCQSQNVSCVDVRTSREKAALHGRRIRSVARMEPRSKSGLVLNPAAAARWVAASGSTSQLHLQERTGVVGPG